MSVKIFKETDRRGRWSGRVVAARAGHPLPASRDAYSWRLDTSGFADNSLTAQVMHEGYVLGIAARDA